MTASPLYDRLYAEHYGDLLENIDADPQPRNADMTAAIKAVILRDGREHDGAINPNRVRAALRDMPLFHKRIGAAYYALRAQKLIERDGVIESDDAQGRNAGKLIRAYRLTDAGWAA